VRLVPKLPAGFPAPSVFARLVGAALIAVGIALLTGRLGRAAAAALAVMILLVVVLFYGPALVWSPPLERPYLHGFMWTNPLKSLALAGGAAMLAARLPGSPQPLSALVSTLARRESLGPPLLALFLVVCGLQHFAYRDFVTSLVPAWIPAPLFWAYFTGVALMMGGVGILVPRTSRLAARMSALMIFLWVVLLHIPRALAGPSHANETAGVFEALAITGVALLVAGTRGARSAGSPELLTNT
jgi:uncharacterized membrane protein YphA (DoxX/SURF4 family)